MKFFLTLISIFAILSTPLISQDTPQIDLGAYADTYIATDNSYMSSDYMRDYAVVNGRESHFGLNIAQICANISYKNMMRATVIFHYGDIPAQSFGVEYPAVQQANVGVMLFENIWLDGGYFLTHIGSEALLPKDNWLSSHNMVTYYEPFFQAGFRAGYEAENLTIHIYVLNGDGIFEDNNKNFTYAAFIGYQISDQFSVSYANEIGNEAPLGSPAQTHQHHNICAQFDVNDQLSFKGQLDIASIAEADIEEGSEQVAEYPETSFLGIAVQGRYAWTDEHATSARFSFIQNEDGLYGTTPFASGMGITLGQEFKPTSNSYIRLEGRMLDFGDDPSEIFMDADGEPMTNRMEIMLNFGVWVN